MAAPSGTASTRACSVSTRLQSGAVLTAFKMEIITPINEGGFVVREAFKRDMPHGLYPVVMGSSKRVEFALVDGEELDELICKAFDCDDTDNTFRGHLREAVARVNPNAFTSACGWRMGVEADTCQTAEPTLLITVRPGSINQMEAISMIKHLRQVLHSYDQRLGSGVAIEIAERIIEPAKPSETSSKTSRPSNNVMDISYRAPPGAGASVGVAKRIESVGTLGPIICISQPDAGVQFCYLTCSHVLSDARYPVIPAKNSAISDAKSIVCPAERDHFSWWQDAQRNASSTDPTLAQQGARNLKQLGSCECVLGSMYACSGISTSPEGHWVRDWAAIMPNTERFKSFDHPSNVPSDDIKRQFAIQDQITLTQEEWKAMDWNRPDGCRYLSFDGLEREQHLCQPVFKVGRTTGCTVGRIHRVEPSVTISYPLVAPDGEPCDVQVKGKVLVVAADQFGGVFAKQGDSGALVLNSHAQGVGIVCAMGLGDTYISPIGPNLEHIREVVEKGVGQRVTVEYL